MTITAGHVKQTTACWGGQLQLLKCALTLKGDRLIIHLDSISCFNYSTSTPTRFHKSLRLYDAPPKSNSSSKNTSRQDVSFLTLELVFSCTADNQVIAVPSVLNSPSLLPSGVPGVPDDIQLDSKRKWNCQ